MNKISTKVRIPLLEVKNKKIRNRNEHLTKYGKDDLVVVCTDDEIVTMEYFDSAEHLEFSLKDLPRIIDVLIFVDTQENKFPKPKKIKGEQNGELVE